MTDNKSCEVHFPFHKMPHVLAHILWMLYFLLDQVHLQVTFKPANRKENRVFEQFSRTDLHLHRGECALPHDIRFKCQVFWNLILHWIIWSLKTRGLIMLKHCLYVLYFVILFQLATLYFFLCAHMCFQLKTLSKNYYYTKFLPLANFFIVFIKH